MTFTEEPSLYAPHNVTLAAPVLESGPKERRPRLYFTIGAARSGKSTYAQRWAQGLEMADDYDGYPRVRWNTDSLRLASHGRRYAHEFEPLAFGIKQVAIEALLLAGHDVIVDGTHTTHESIRRILEVDEDATPILFDVPQHVCCERAHNTGQSDLVPVIARHCRQIEILKEEGVGNVINRLVHEIRVRRGMV